MHKHFISWVEMKKENLEKIGISTENINVTAPNVPNPSITVDHISQKCIGRVSVWESGQIDIEVLDLETEKRLLYEYYEIGENADFDKILDKYLKTLTNVT